MKECFKCRVVKPLSEFYRHAEILDGHLNKCKECAKRDVQTNYKTNREHYVEYERGRAGLPHRVEARKRYMQTERGREAHREAGIRWRCSEYGQRKIAEHNVRYRLENPEKRKAHHAVNNAVRSGRVKKQTCETCGSQRTRAHHEDYSKPLDVRWLCPKHHKAAHREMSQGV